MDGRTGMESCLHDTLEDDDFVVIGAGRHGAQGLYIRGHVLQVMGSPHRSGQVGPTLFEGSLGSKEFVEKADRNAQHGGQSQTPADHLAPPWVHVHIVVGQGLIVHQVEQKDTYADTWSYKRPAPLHPGEGPVADHTSHIIHEAVSTVDPGNYYAFPECLPQQSHPTGRIVVKQLEDVHPSLCHHGEVNNEAE